MLPQKSGKLNMEKNMNETLSFLSETFVILALSFAFVIAINPD